MFKRIKIKFTIRSEFIEFFSIILFAILLSINLVSAANSESYRPYIHKPSVGQYPKLEMYGNYKTQLFPGAATYSYGIAVPPGVNGLAPEITLSYSSQSATQYPTIVGVGWSTSSNYIMRNINFTILNTSDDYFVINLNGYSDKVVYRIGVYKTNIETYLKIENKTLGGNTYWIVTSTDGTKYNFGLTSDSLLQSNASNYTLKWFLSSIQDSHGNLVNYSYQKNPYSGDYGAVYLTNITYNNDLLRRVFFRYEPSVRPDKRLIYEQGSAFLESRRLIGIDVYFNTSLVRKYNLSYLDLDSDRTLTSLANITYIGADNSSVLNTVSFEYYGEQAGFENSSCWLVPEEFSSINGGSQDYGIRLVDVNNDGFMDFVKSNATINYTSLNDKNSSWNSSSLFSVPEQIVDGTNQYQGVMFVDMNKDGLVDLIKSKGGVSRKVYLNNGSLWKNYTGTWQLPVDFFNSSGGDEGVRLMDLNGDSWIDIVQGKASGSINLVWLNNGSGWSNVSNFRLPDYFISSDSSDNGLREIDLNGDGLTDLIKGGQPGLAWLNNGTGWVNNTLFAPNLNFTNSSTPDLGVRFIDINGDSLTDIIQNFYSNISIFNQTCYNLTNSTQNCTSYSFTNLTNVKINNGTGWVYNQNFLSPESFTYNGFNTGRRIADVNGDGYSDIVVGLRNASFERKTLIRNATSAFTLKRLRNAYGGTTSIVYDRSTLSNNGQNLGFNLWVVSNITLNNSLNGSFAFIGKTLYSYFGGKFDYPNNEFFGFNLVNETLNDGGILSHFFYQDPVLKGKEYLTRAYNFDSKKLKDSYNFYTYTSDNKIYLNGTGEYSFEGNALPLAVNTTYSYDSYGNVVFVNYSGNVALLGDEKYEEYRYIYNTTAYIVSKVSNYSLYSGNGSIAKRSWFSYDSLTSGVTKGDLTSASQYYNLGQNIQTNASYDSFGNKISDIDALGNPSNYSYDTETNSFVIKATNALGHAVYYGYDKGTGNKLYEEKDKISRNYTYDTFGRITKEFITPDNITLPTKRTSYQFDGVSPESIMVEIKNNDSDYGETIYIYDGFSNPVQVRSKYSPTLQLVKNYLYDGKFRIVEEPMPYFQNYSTQMNYSSSSSNIKYQYDSFDRVTNVTKRDNSSVLVLFNSTRAVSINELGIRKEYILDGYGRIINVYEHNRNSSGTDEIYNTSYIYDISNNLLTIIDVLNNSFLFEYDSLGRKVSIDDPNMEKWTYVYDSNGNLVSQTDGRNVTVLLRYDKLNRLLNKSSGNMSVKFFYDQQLNGTLTNITYNGSAIFDIIYYQYIYDNRSRVVQEKLYFDFQTQPISRSQEAALNYWINTTIEYDSSDRIVKKYLPNQSYDYLFLTGSNLTTLDSFPNATLVYEYNSLNKLKKINDFVINSEYNEFGNLLNKTAGNGLISYYGYDTQNRINRIVTGSIQNISYSYDASGNILQINDSKNKMTYSMIYDDLDRLTQTIIFNWNIYEHEKYSFVYNKIGSILFKTNDLTASNYSYNSSMAHPPYSINEYNRSTPRIELTLIDPITTKNVTRYTLFNTTIQACCKDNDCWGINVSLDPEEHTFTSSTETVCKDGLCSTSMFSGTRFVYENESWKKIEDAQSLNGAFSVRIKLDSNFPAKVIDFNYTSIILNLSVSIAKVNQQIPLKVYNSYNSSQLLLDKNGNTLSKDTSLKFSSPFEEKTVVIDLSGSVDSILDETIKWGNNSTIITIYDNNSLNIGDSYLRNETSYKDINYGTQPYLIVKNSTSSNIDPIIRFDISQIPRQALVDDARIYLYIGTTLYSGREYNISVYSVNQTYLWNESTITWTNGPRIGSDYNPIYLDKININSSDISKFVSWNVTVRVQNKTRNESFYFRAIENIGGTPTDDVEFRSKEYSPATQRPYLNVTYRLKGLVSNTIGETPFYTSLQNPYYVDLEQNQCQNITWSVNATGNIGDYLFFSYANKTYNASINAYTDLVWIKIK